MQPPMQPPAKPKKNMMIYAIIAIVVVIALVLVVVLLMSGVSTGTPEGTIRAAFDAINRYDAKGVLDLTVDKFLSSTEYNIELNTMTLAFAMIKTLGVKFTVADITVKTQAQMTQSERNDANSTIADLPSQGIPVTVTDYCLVSYTMGVSGFGGIPGGAQTDLLVKINGAWYIGSGMSTVALSDSGPNRLDIARDPRDVSFSFTPSFVGKAIS